MKDNTIRKDFLLTFIDKTEELMKLAETDAEKKLVYETLKHVNDNVVFIDSIKH